MVDGIRARDGDVFAFIDRRYKPSIVHLIRDYGGTDTDADDIFHDGVLRLIEMVDEDDFELSAKISTLLYAICKKKWKLNLEKSSIAKKYFTRKSDDDTTPDAIDEMDRKLYNEIFWGSFKRLKKECQIILKALMKGIPLKDVAVTMDYSYEYIRRKKTACYTFLQNIIEQHKDYKLIKKKEGSVKLY